MTTTTATDKPSEAAKYLEKPYARRLIPDTDGGYVASIQEFPGLIADGDSAEEALRNLETAALAWIEASLSMGQPIPEPVELGGYSGKLALRMPRGLHKRAAEMAASENTSLNQWIVSAVAHYLGGKEAVKVVVDTYLMKVNVYSTATNTYNFYNWKLAAPQIGATVYPYLDSSTKVPSPVYAGVSSYSPPQFLTAGGLAGAVGGKPHG